MNSVSASLGLIIITSIICIYIINPNDIFRIQSIINNQQKKRSSIDSDSVAIVNILKNQPDGAPTVENIILLEQKFGKCFERLINSESSFHRFFASTSYMVSIMLGNKVGPFPDYAYDIFVQNLEVFTTGLKNKDFVTCYECITNFLYLSTVRDVLPGEHPFNSDTTASEAFGKISTHIMEFPARNSIIRTLDENQHHYDAKLYIFLRYLDVVNTDYYKYSKLQEFDETLISGEAHTIQKLFNKFKKSYINKDIPQQCRVLIKLSGETNEIEDYIIPTINTTRIRSKTRTPDTLEGVKRIARLRIK